MGTKAYSKYEQKHQGVRKEKHAYDSKVSMDLIINLKIQPTTL